MLENDITIAKGKKFKNYPTLEQIRKVIFEMPTTTEIEKRNQALIVIV